MNRGRTRPASAWISRDFPMPASPDTSTTAGRPEATPSCASSAGRPRRPVGPGSTAPAAATPVAVAAGRRGVVELGRLRGGRLRPDDQRVLTQQRGLEVPHRRAGVHPELVGQQGPATTAGRRARRPADPPGERHGVQRPPALVQRVALGQGGESATTSACRPTASSATARSSRAGGRTPAGGPARPGGRVVRELDVRLPPPPRESIVEPPRPRDLARSPLGARARWSGTRGEWGTGPTRRRSRGRRASAATLAPAQGVAVTDRDQDPRLGTRRTLRLEGATERGDVPVQGGQHPRPGRVLAPHTLDQGCRC